MRKVIVGLLLLFLAGCARRTEPWRLGSGAVDACDVTGTVDSPVLGQVTAFGLGSRMPWLPGGAVKVNWVEHGTGGGQLTLELRRPGAASTPGYRLEVPSGPSLVGFPEPGCWDLTVAGGESSGTTRVWLEPARPVGLVAAGEGDPAGVGALAAEWLDEAVARQVLSAAAAAKPGAADSTGESALLYLVWQAGEERFYTPVVFFPGNGVGQAPRVAVQKSLLTGDCQDADVPVAAPVARKLAGRLEQELEPGLRFTGEVKAPWRLYEAHCYRFDNRK